MSTSMTEEPFTIFHKFPPEVQLEILRQCSEGDLVCLSLTCRDMHYLAKPLLPEKPDLSKVDQLGSTPDMPQDYMDSNCICSNGNKGCKGARGRIVAYDPDTHRNRRHYYKKRYAACYECRAYPPEHPVCLVAGCKKHCACISCPLFMRLRGWMGSRKYCRPCNKFTTRRKTNNGRCLHGRKKVRKTPNNHWTTRKGLSYGYRWWRRWGTHNVDNEAYQPDARPRINARIV